jgi:hypothetical protein
VIVYIVILFVIESHFVAIVAVVFVYLLKFRGIVAMIMIILILILLYKLPYLWVSHIFMWLSFSVFLQKI